MKNVWMMACVVAAALGAAGCDGGDEEGTEYTISEGTLSGKIGGKAWKFVAGGTNDFLSDEEGFFTVLFDVEAETCGSIPQEAERTVLLNVPRKAGSYDLSLSRSVTLAVGSDNRVSTTGSMIVKEVTDTEITVGLYAIVDGDSNFEVDGYFTAVVCPP